VLAQGTGANHPETAPAANSAEDDAQNGQPPPPGAVDEQAPGTIALLAKLEKQIAENHIATPPSDNAADTLQAILTLLPNAPLADSQLVAAAFSHFADRARKAEAAGRHDEAKRFATFSVHSGGTTDAAAPTRAAAQQKYRVQPPREMKAATAKPEPAAEPTAKPTPVKADARTAVLARLRRQAPAQAAKHHRVASDAPSTVAPTGAPVVPPRQRLLDARAALAAGRIGEAEELLRQAQVQLVLRQTTPSQEASATGSVAAGQVAEALSMLNAGDAQHAMQYINLAAVQAGQGQTGAAATPR
jgi:hypothetical protein